MKPWPDDQVHRGVPRLEIKGLEVWTLKPRVAYMQVSIPLSLRVTQVTGLCDGMKRTDCDAISTVMSTVLSERRNSIHLSGMVTRNVRHFSVKPSPARSTCFRLCDTSTWVTSWALVPMLSIPHICDFDCRTIKGKYTSRDGTMFLTTTVHEVQKLLFGNWYPFETFNL